MAAAAPPERVQRALLAPLSLARVLAAPELQPMRTAAAAAGHVALSMCGGRALYVFDGPLPTAPAGRGPAAHTLERGAQATLLSSHGASPVCALAYVERVRAVFLVALQEDAGVAVWVRDAGKLTGEWRPLAAVEAYAAGPPLALPPAAGHRGDVRAACVCAHSPRQAASAPGSETATAPAPRAAVDLTWLLHSRDGGRTELLVRVVPLTADTLPGEARGAAQRSCPVERLGKYADATRLLCAGGGDLWVWTSRGVAYRWCLHQRRCLARVDVAAACGCAPQPATSGFAAPVPTLHHPTRELLALCSDGSVLAVSPALRPAAARDDGFADGQLRVEVRWVGTLEHGTASGAAHDIAAQGSLVFALRANVAQVVGVARNPYVLSIHHAPTGKQLSMAELPALGASNIALSGMSAGPPTAGLLNAHGAGGTFLWMGGAGASCVALLVPDACAALAALAEREELNASPPNLAAVMPEPATTLRNSADDKLHAIAALLCEASSWGGSLERCEAALAVALTQAALRASCAPGTDEYAALLTAAERSRAGLWRTFSDSDKLSGALHPALRSMVALQPLLYAAAADSPVIALAATQAAEAIRDVYSPAASSSSSVSPLEAFRVYTPLAAAIAPLAMTALQSQGNPAIQTETATPAWLWAALLDGKRAENRSRAAGNDFRREWAQAGLKLAAVATRECQQKRNLAAVASLTLFTFQLRAEVACECASLGCLRHHSPRQIDKLDASPNVRASLLANALAHAAAPNLDLPGRPNALKMPDFEAACLCLAETSPSAIPLFVCAASALAAAAISCHETLGKPAHDQMHLAQRALNVLQPALDGAAPSLYACRAALRAAICSHAELLCLAGRPAAGMWLALHPTDASDGQPDWATAVRLLERECAPGGSCNSREGSMLAVPLMFEVLALKVCETLAPDDDDLLGLEPEDESEALAACVAHLFIAAKTVGAAVRRNASANLSMAIIQPHEPPLTVLDAVHDLLEQSVHRWRFTARLKA